MEISTRSSQSGEPSGGLIKDSNLAGFMADVIQPSMQVPVLVDFWAPWCGPCKQLSPLLEKAVTAAGGRVLLVKVNIDEPQNAPLAQQLRIQSIPAVYAFVRGQPVDGFLGALPESQIRAFIERIAGGALESPVAGLLEEAKAALDAGNAELAEQLYGEVVEAEPDNAVALAGLIRCATARGDLARAQALLQAVPAALANDAEIASARAAVALAEQSTAAGGDIQNLQAKVAANPDDHQSRFDLALALVSAGQRETAVDELLEIVRRNRAWNDDAARKQLVTLFEAFGPTDPLTIDARKRLSSLLFR